MLPDFILGLARKGGGTMREKLKAVLAWAEKLADAADIVVPAARKLISLFGDDKSSED